MKHKDDAMAIGDILKVIATGEIITVRGWDDKQMYCECQDGSKKCFDYGPYYEYYC